MDARGPRGHERVDLDPLWVLLFTVYFGELVFVVYYLCSTVHCCYFSDVGGGGGQG